MIVRTDAGPRRCAAGLVLFILLSTGGMGPAQTMPGAGHFRESSSGQTQGRAGLDDVRLAGSAELWKFRRITTHLGGR
jgi:hypothetical protein